MFFTDDQDQALAIERMVIHLVGPTAAHFQLLEEFNPGKFSAFFIDRVRALGGGSIYDFSDASSTRERLRRIIETPNSFQEESEKLADDFQTQHGGSTSPGAFAVMVLNGNNQTFYALLKFDDEAVLSYEVKVTEEGKKCLSMAQLERTFVQNKKALQKAALIRLTDEGGELLALDRVQSQGVARYFENFLGAKRRYDDEQLTKLLCDSAKDAILRKKEHVSPNVLRNLSERIFTAASAGGNIAAESNAQSFLEAILGAPCSENDPVLGEFQRQLRQKKITGAGFVLKSDLIKPPSARRLTTQNGIVIRVPADKRTMIEERGDEIVIKDTLKDEYDETDGNSR